MRRFENKVPPPVITVLVGAGMWAAARISTQVPIRPGVRIAVAALLFALGLAVAIAGVLAFRRSQTTVSPLKPDAASALVVSGIYRYSRNPMYLGLAFGLLAWAVYLSAPLTLLGLPLFILLITRLQIIPEERVLSKKFGRQFTDYQHQVRRWL
jgi:protein-S-isoprenylcysteine O-methyltransferase Ste14